jgi:hypothetical protein
MLSSAAVFCYFLGKRRAVRLLLAGLFGVCNNGIYCQCFETKRNLFYNCARWSAIVFLFSPKKIGVDGILSSILEQILIK